MSKRKVKLPLDRNGTPINIDDWLMFDDGSFHVSTLTYYGKGVVAAIGGCWIDNDGDYSPENCRWVKNYSLQVRNRRHYEYASHRKAVIRTSKDGDEVTFKSIREAARQTTGNVKSASNIAMCCRGERRSAYGYTWRLAGEGE